ncbi:hypothetical protein AAFF_G00260660 [Aldrovandia affinis]|uniref:A disintegrin and metalloproteinase with thrombospondin motifs 20 n=1 Tax=Aldrovandia affinis TaxID=143900 RepID=A0AAD7W2U2_9TELE|nr:hypothetical protein AAFF_G00260660 [Aldrovandia affinis]
METWPLHGEWGPWGPYSVCSRSCGGGTRSTARDCNQPEPRNGGRFCVGRRMKFRSCSTEPCPRDRRDFREEQCSHFDGRHFNINGLPPSVRWVPKYSGILMKDRCKLFCRVAGTTAYYQLKDRVVDGTQCGPDTDDICVQGLCRQAGCDHVLNSKARNDKCGVCGGDNSSCRTLAGTFNNAQYGYNIVVRIPAGATNIDIKQVSYSGRPEDDNYLALSDSQNNYLLNGNFVVAMFKKEINFKGTVIEYSGSDTQEEHINCTERIEDELVLQVLCVGNLYNPDVRYSFNIPIEEQEERFVWDPSGPWLDCSRLCQGERSRRVACVRHGDRLVVPDQRCDLSPRPSIETEPCHTDCELRWHVAGQSECSARCGSGFHTQDVRCVRYSLLKRQTQLLESSSCSHLPNPHQTALPRSLPQPGLALRTLCSRTCGRGTRTRDSYCADRLGRRLEDRECAEPPRGPLSEGCGAGTALPGAPATGARQVFCRLKQEKLSDDLCDPTADPGGGALPSPCLRLLAAWGLEGGEHPTVQHRNARCAVTCGRGYRMREVRCVSGVYGEVLDDRECNTATRPRDSQDCEAPPCPQPPPAVITNPPDAPQCQWLHGSWTTCSVSCGGGARDRYVSCRDARGGMAEESCCTHLPRPPESSPCFSACGQWQVGDWAPCSVTCGMGRSTRQVMCSTYHHHQVEQWCDPDQRPGTEQECRAPPCPAGYSPSNHPDNHPGHDSWNVPPTDHQWRTGPWSSCSSTCAAGFQRRAVVCQDTEGRATSRCQERVKPAESKSCDSGPCPRWNHGAWQEVSGTAAPSTRTPCCDSSKRRRFMGRQQTQGTARCYAFMSYVETARIIGPALLEKIKTAGIRLVVCERSDGQRLNQHNCNALDRPTDVERCNEQPCAGGMSWHRRPWSPVR